MYLLTGFYASNLQNHLCSPVCPRNTRTLIPDFKPEDRPANGFKKPFLKCEACPPNSISGRGYKNSKEKWDVTTCECDKGWYVNLLDSLSFVNLCLLMKSISLLSTSFSPSHSSFRLLFHFRIKVVQFFTASDAITLFRGVYLRVYALVHRWGNPKYPDSPDSEPGCRKCSEGAEEGQYYCPGGPKRNLCPQFSKSGSIYDWSGKTPDAEPCMCVRGYKMNKDGTACVER